MRKLQHLSVLPITLVLLGFLNSFPTGSALPHIKTVFIIIMENHNWSEIEGNPSATYINQTLLPMGAYAKQYYSAPDIHPSLPNYLWLEAGTNFGISDDNGPDVHHQGTTQHLVTLLNQAGVSWRAYQEDIKPNTCPVDSAYPYAVRHNPFVYFEDVAGNPPDVRNAYCVEHIVPYTQLSPDLKSNTVAQYNFITANVCNDMHDSRNCKTGDSIGNGDAWLAQEVPNILDSQAYKDNGVLFIVWDESEDHKSPIGLIALSPLAKRGYSNDVYYTHGSTLRTIQEIFNVTPFLGDAANQADLSDLFDNALENSTATPSS